MQTWIFVTGIALVGLLLAEARRDRIVIWIAKPLASIGFVGAAVAAGALGSGYGRALLLGLLFSFVGDVLLIPESAGAYLAGLICFLCAHLAYCTAFVLRGPSLPWIAAAVAALAVPALLVERWLGPRVPASLRVPVRIYMLVVSAMLAVAAGDWRGGSSPLAFAGAFAFYLSDLAVARDRFVHESFWNQLWGLPLYYAAQLMLAASVGG